MTTSGLVLNLDDDADQVATTIREVLLAGPFTLGDVYGHRVAMALEADTPADAERWHRWLTTLPGVISVDVAFVHLDTVAEEAVHDR